MKIALDAGHGPDTPGKRTPDGSMREFQFNNVVANYAAELLKSYEGVQTIFTHAPDGSRDVPLKERTNKANSWKADILISIHANASGDGWSNAEGIETFTYILPSAASIKLATAVQRKLVLSTARRDRGVKQDNLHMVREARMPAILVECGFMTNRAEAELLKANSYRMVCANAIVEGIAAAYGLVKKEVKEEPDMSGQFTDVPATHWATGAISTAVEAGVVKGYADGTFKPDQSVSRAELAVIIARLLKQ